MFQIHEAISDGMPVPSVVELPPAETEQFFHSAAVRANITRTGETYVIDCLADDVSGKSFRIIAKARFKVNSSSDVEEFQILAYERCFSGD